MLKCGEEEVVFEKGQVRRMETNETVSLTDIAYKTQVFNEKPAEATATHTSPVSTPP